MSRNSTGPRSRRGTVAVVTALMLIVLIGFTAFAVDLTWLVSVGTELQAGADNSALAGAQRVRRSQSWAQDLAQTIGESNRAAQSPVYLRRNDANDAAGDIVLGRFDLAADTFTVASYDNDGIPDIAPNAVKVVARRSGTASVDSVDGALPLLFGPVLGKETADLNRMAIAMVTGSSGAGIIALCPDCQCSFRVNGNVMIDVGDAAIQVNSTHPCAACGNGIPLVMAAELNISGPEWCDTPKVDVIADVNVDADIVPDPLAGLPDPAPGTNRSCTYAEGATLSPGFYGAGIKHTTGLVNLNPGVYYLDGRINGGAPTIVDFDTIPIGETIDFATDSTWVGGGSVETYPYNPPPAIPGDPAPPTEYPLAASGMKSYAVAVGLPLTIDFDPPMSKVDFFYVHDSVYGFGVPQGSVQAIGICGNTVYSGTSNQATVFDDPANWVHIVATAEEPVERLVFIDGGVIDSLGYTPIKGGLHIGGGSTFTALGVMFYIAGGGVNVQGNSFVHITAIDSTQYAYTNGEAVYDGVSFFQARDNPSPPSANVNSADFMGTSDTEIYGQLYFPSAQVEIGGTPLALGSGIIAYTIWLHGTADSWRNLDPLTNPNLRVFLVK